MGGVLVFGAAGRFGAPLVSELSGRGIAVRAFVRGDAQADAARAAGAAEVVIGDLADADATEAALGGIEGVFHVSPVGLAAQAEIGRRLVAQAERAGVRRFVFSSVIHPVLADLPNHAAKAPVEAALVSSGLEWTILHPAVLFQNLGAAWQRVVSERVLAEPWSNATRHSRVDVRDVAAVAAIALVEGRLAHGTFELCAAGAPDRTEIAAMIGAILGGRVEAIRIDPATLPAEMAGLQPMFAHYDRQGLRGNPLMLRAILGREPRGLQAYVDELVRGAG